MKTILVVCQICATEHEMGNGQIAAAEKRGYVHHLGHCPQCERKTWSEPFKLRPMTAAEIKEAISSLNVQVEERRAARPNPPQT